VKFLSDLSHRRPHNKLFVGSWPTWDRRLWLFDLYYRPKSGIMQREFRRTEQRWAIQVFSRVTPDNDETTVTDSNYLDV